METRTLPVSGMACGGCASNVRQALMALDGVAEAEVSHAGGSAEITFDPAKVTVAQMAAAIQAAGYLPGPV